MASFAWQGGYGAFSVSQSHAAAVVRYIETQEKHHQRFTFQQELTGFLDKYQVAYDPQRIWE